MRIKEHPLRSERAEEEVPENTIEKVNMEKVTELVHTCLALEKE